MLRLATLLLALSIMAPAVWADDLDVMVDETVSVETRAEAQARLAAAEFRPLMARLSELISSHRIETELRSGMNSPCDKPEKLNERQRIGCKLRQLWREQMAAAKERGDAMELMLGLLEDPSVGLGKNLVVWEVSARLHFASMHHDPALPPLREILQRLDRVVQNPREYDSHRRVIIDILMEHGDQNKYLDLALDLFSTGDPPIHRSAIFGECARHCLASKLTPANRRKYLLHAFRLLEEIDDGHSGHGYGLASQIGRFIGIPPVRQGTGSFAPDQRLPEYQKPSGLNEKFFQDTVNNARKWWEENKATL
jgi:hypothetical protein